MPSDFVPFLPSARKSSASGPAVAAARHGDSAAASGAFTAIVPGPSPALPGCAHAGNNAAKPTVTLQKDGDRVTHIRVQCACGEVIELECSY